MSSSLRSNTNSSQTTHVQESNPNPAPDRTYDRRSHQFQHNSYNVNIPSHRPGRFEGKCPDLKGYICDCQHVHQANQYSRTTKEIAEFSGQTFRHGMDIQMTSESLENITLNLPDDPPDNATKTELRLWEKRTDEYILRKSTLIENIKTTYSIIRGQCTEAMRQRIEAAPSFSSASTTGNAIELLKIIRNISFDFESQQYFPHALYEAHKRFYNF
jgi:hypothetical protein